MRKILIINGPNLNMLGIREPGLYGSESLDQINAGLKREAKKLSVSIETFQSNSEGAIVDRIHAALSMVDVIIINPAAYTHTSVAIRDALIAVNIPVIEVHISNIHKREDFRQKSFISDIALGQISGFGIFGYQLALRAAIDHIDRLPTDK